MLLASRYITNSPTRRMVHGWKIHCQKMRISVKESGQRMNQILCMSTNMRTKQNIEIIHQEFINSNRLDFGWVFFLLNDECLIDTMSSNIIFWEKCLCNKLRWNSQPMVLITQSKRHSFYMVTFTYPLFLNFLHFFILASYSICCIQHKNIMLLVRTINKQLFKFLLISIKPVLKFLALA